MCAERRPRPGRAERGVTLTELMVAMGMTSLVAVMLLAAAQVQTNLSRQTGQTQYVQDNVRSAMEEIVQNVRRTGKSSTTTGMINAVPPRNPAVVYGVNIINGANAPDTLNLILVNEDTSPTATLMMPFYQLPPAPGIPPTPAYASPVNITAANLIRVNNALGMGTGSLFVLSNFRDAILYQMTGNPVTVGANFDLPVTPPLAAPASYMSAPSIVNRATLVSYRVDTTVIPGTPVLVLQDGAPLDMSRPPEIIAENIEDLQVAIGVDGLLTGVADKALVENGRAANDDEWIFNFPGEAMPVILPPGATVSSVRITVVGRTAVASEQIGPGRAAVEDRPAGAADFFRRRSLTTQISMRKMGAF